MVALVALSSTGVTLENVAERGNKMFGYFEWYLGQIIQFHTLNVQVTKIEFEFQKQPIKNSNLVR